MSDDLIITAGEVEALAAKLDALDVFSTRERTILTGVFLLAGQVAADELLDDVSGFMPTAVERMSLNFTNSALPGYLSGKGLLLPAVQVQADPPSELPGAFSAGMHGAGGGGGAG